MKLADLATGSDWIVWIVYIALGIILVDVVVIIILGNTLCRKQ